MSRAKGIRGELELAELLTGTFYPNGDGECVRTPMSGAWHGMNVLCGDIIPVVNGEYDKSIPFYFEVKNMKDMPLAEIMSGNDRSFSAWIKKANLEARKSGAGIIPLIFWKIFRTKWFVYFSYGSWRAMLDTYGPLPSTFTSLIHVLGEVGDLGYVVLSFDTFNCWIRNGRIRRA